MSQKSQLHYELMRKFINDPRTAPVIKTVASVLSERRKELPTLPLQAAYYHDLEEHLFAELDKSQHLIPMPSSILKAGIALVARIGIGSSYTAECLKDFRSVRLLAEDRLLEAFTKYRHFLPKDTDPAVLVGRITDYVEQSRFENKLPDGSSCANNQYYRNVLIEQRLILENLPLEIYFYFKHALEDFHAVSLTDYDDEMNMKNTYAAILARIFPSNWVRMGVTKLSLGYLLSQLSKGDARKMIESYMPPTDKLSLMPKVSEITHPAYT